MSTARIPQFASTQEPRRFRLLRPQEVDEMPEPEWIVENILPGDSLSMISGKSGVGKSFVTLDLALCVAAGQAWQGHEVKGGAVVYVAAEGAGGYQRRMRAWARHHRTPLRELPFCLVKEPINLFSETDADEFIAVVRDEFLEVGLIVFDTLGRCMDGADENDNGQMNQVISAARRIQRETGATVLLVHHMGHSKDAGSKRPRGASALIGGVDMSATIIKQSGALAFECGKQKDGPEFEKHTLRLTEIDLGDGKSSMVVIQAVEDEQNSPLARTLTETARQTSPDEPSTRVDEEHILQVLRQAGRPLGPAEVAGRIPGYSRHAAKMQLRRMCREEKVFRPETGKYAAAHR